jgi:hypothetical protein
VPTATRAMGANRCAGCSHRPSMLCVVHVGVNAPWRAAGARHSGRRPGRSRNGSSPSAPTPATAHAPAGRRPTGPRREHDGTDALARLCEQLASRAAELAERDAVSKALRAELEDLRGPAEPQPSPERHSADRRACFRPSGALGAPGSPPAGSGPVDRDTRRIPRGHCHPPNPTDRPAASAGRRTPRAAAKPGPAAPHHPWRTRSGCSPATYAPTSPPDTTTTTPGSRPAAPARMAPTDHPGQPRPRRNPPRP